MSIDRPSHLGTLFRPFDDRPTITDTALRPPSAEPSSAPPAVSAALPSQEGAPRYEVRSVLGRGGMGEVRLCRDERIGREIAVKVMLPVGAGHDEARARFIREARIQAQLEHPAIVPVHEVEVFDDGTAYFTMKRVRGQTLSSILSALAQGDEEAQRKFSRRRLLQAFATVCLAADFAHARGVVHRDLKPQNIMLGDFGEVYVLDWGVAKLVDHDEGPQPVDAAPLAPGEAGASRAGAILGTPGYMAPEQLDGERGAVTRATDVYALGAILFEILTWTPLVPRDLDELEVVMRTLHGVDARASQRAPARAVPAALERACVRACALAPQDRFPSARALWLEVDNFLEGELDVERRRGQAVAHVRAAERLLEKAGADEADPDRAAAYGELSRAIALDPDNGDARAALVRLLTAPPRAVPEEVRARVREVNHRIERTGARMNVPVSLSWLAAIPLAALAGTRDWSAIALVIAPLLGVAAVSLWVSRRAAPPSLGPFVVITLLTFAAYLALAQYLGPFVLAPGLFCTYAVTLQASPLAAARRVAAALAAVCFVASLAIEWVTEASYRFVDGALVVAPRALEIERGSAFVMVGVTTLAVLVGTSMVVANVRRMLTAAEEQLLLQSWRLERLVPVAVQGRSRT